MDSSIYLVQVGNGGNITENSAEFNITGTHSLTSFANLRLKETPGKVIEKLNFGNCLVIVDLRWREDKPGEGVEKLYFNIYLVSAEGERKMTRGIGRISTSAVGETMKADGGINGKMEMDEIKMDERVKIDHGDITDISAPRW